MGKKYFLLITVFFTSLFAHFAAANDTAETISSSIKTDVVSVTVQPQYESVKPGSKVAIAVHFKLEKNWHFYASEKTAPGKMNLKVMPASANNAFIFSEPVFPKAKIYDDKSSGQKLDVFSDDFTVYLPFTVSSSIPDTETVDVNIALDGAICSDVQCRIPKLGLLTMRIKISNDADMANASFTLPNPSKQVANIETAAPSAPGTNYSAWFALGLALLAGLSLNVMPCVWPVLPIVIMRLVEQAKKSKEKSLTMGLAFCTGILLFFAVLAAANIVLQLVFGTVLQWGDQFRNPSFIAIMSILLVVLALSMFDIVVIALPSSVASKSGSGKGLAGSIAMGFLSALLSTPCSFAILAAAFAWAQAQPLPLATLAIMTIGLGMAIPYFILTSMPRLLNRVPRPGKWMDLFKKSIGFVLLAIAIKLIAALPENRRISILYFAVILSFAIWMWTGWVDFNTKAHRKRLVRFMSVLIIVIAGWAFLPAPHPAIIDWQPYDANSIQASIEHQRPVLIKFTADWCLNCQVTEKAVYSRPDIAKLIKDKNILAIKADTTQNDFPATLALKNVYKQPGVPLTVLILPGQKEPVMWNGIFFADPLKGFLEKLPMETK
jgi:thiol:disulfide interchange protein